MSGDFNAHAPAWDQLHRLDDLGEEISDWMLTNSMFPANDGSSTRANPQGGNNSAPDVTMLHSFWDNKYEWRTLDPMTSDHHPILLDLKTGAREMPPVKNYPVYAKAHWDEFHRTLDEELKKGGAAEVTSVDKLNKIVTRAIQVASKAAIPRNRRQLPKPWWSSELDGMMESCRTDRRQYDLSKSDEDKEKWLRTKNDLAERVEELKEECWHEFASTELNYSYESGQSNASDSCYRRQHTLCTTWRGAQEWNCFFEDRQKQSAGFRSGIRKSQQGEGKQKRSKTQMESEGETEERVRLHHLLVFGNFEDGVQPSDQVASHEEIVRAG